MLIVSALFPYNQHFSTVYNSQSVESIPGLPAAKPHYTMFLLSAMQPLHVPSTLSHLI